MCSRLAALTQPPTGSSSYRGILFQLGPHGFTTSYTYDAAGNPAARTDANALLTTYGYDPDNRMTQISYPAGTPGVSWDYFAAGGRKTMTDGTGITSYTYDALNRLTSVTFPGPQTVGYQYDAVGNRKVLTYPNGMQTTSLHWPDHLPQSVTDAALPARGISYGYDVAGRLATASRTNGVTSTYGFDAASRLTGIAQPDTSSSTAASVTYGTPDPVGNWPSRAQGSLADNYQYDSLYRLADAGYAEGDCQHYAYDAAGNRLSASTAGSTSPPCTGGVTTASTSDNADRLIKAGLRPYTYDAAGNQVGSGNDRYTYDAENRLIAVSGQPPRGVIGSACADLDNDGVVTILDLTVMANVFLTRRGGPGFDFRADVDWDNAITILDMTVEALKFLEPCVGFRATYTYNGDGLRVSKTENGITTSYVWDVAAPLPVVLQDSQGKTYEYGNGLILQDSGGTPSWYLNDGLGSTVGLTNSAGALTATYRYDVYGRLRGTTGTPSATFTFDGEQTDASGLVYLRARYYDPGTGRFLTQDPLPLPQRYAFVGGNPANFTDPTGLRHIIPCFDSPSPAPWPFAPFNAPDIHVPDIRFDPDVRGNWEYWSNRLRGRDTGGRAEGPPQGPPKPRSLDPSRWYQLRCWQIPSLRGQIVCYTTWVAGILSVAKSLGLDAIVQQYVGPDSVADKEGHSPVSQP